jgi:transposase InsO family protein
MELQDLAVSRLRYGYRRLTILLRRKGWRVNPKRIYRLDRQEGLQAGVPGDEGGAELARCKLQ